MKSSSSGHEENGPAATSNSWMMREERTDRRKSQGPTFRQLYREAKRRGIPGRSHMSKEELEEILSHG